MMLTLNRTICDKSRFVSFSTSQGCSKRGGRGSSGRPNILLKKGENDGGKRKQERKERK